MDKIKNKNTNLNSGIDPALIIDEKNALIEETLCQICLNLANIPKYCKCCGKIFCDICIENWLKKSNTCPNCRNDSFDKPPTILMNFLSKIRLKCQYSKCSKLLLYSEFNTHINLCEYGSFQCFADNCVFIGTKYEVFEHFSNCQNIEQECSHCGTKILRKLMNSHLNVCEMKNKKIDNSMTIEALQKKILELSEENSNLKQKLNNTFGSSNNIDRNSFNINSELVLVEKDDEIPNYKLKFIKQLVENSFNNFQEDISSVTEEIHEKLNCVYGSMWNIIINKGNECNVQVAHFNNELVKLKKNGYSIIIYRSAKILDGTDCNEDSLDIINQSNNIKTDMLKEIKSILKNAKLLFQSSLKERGEYIVKEIEEKYGQFWTVIIGGHFTKVTSFWYNQYLELYYNGILYILYRSSPEENHSETNFKIIRKESGIDDKMVFLMKQLIRDNSIIHKKNLFCRCEAIALELNKNYGSFWSVSTIVWGSSYYSFFLNQLIIISHKEVQYTIYRSANK